MSDYIYMSKATMTAIANAIRTKLNTDNTYKPSQMAQAILSISGNSGGSSDVPIPPIVDDDDNVPQTGTWQLKTTTNKSYVIFGTDDDNGGNAKFLRLLRTYNIPYSMNVEAEHLNRDVGTDIDDAFTDSDAPSVFATNTTPLELGKYIHNNNLGEVSQHGCKVLWDSEKLVGSVLDDVYTTYTDGGGTKTKDELKSAIMEELSITDISQGATYVLDKRNELEDAYGFSIDTVGCWGGTPTPIIDGIELNLRNTKSNAYNWRADNYTVATPYVGQWKPNNNDTYSICRCSADVFDFSDMITMVLSIPKGHVIEAYWHEPFKTVPNINDWRTMFTQLNELVASGRVGVVTKKQYYALGEFVDNPITSISLSRSGNLNVGDTDSDSAYTVTITYADSTSEVLTSEYILDRSAVNTSESGAYTVSVTYRGFNASINVTVLSSDIVYPNSLKDYDYWFVIRNDASNVWYCGNYSKQIVSAQKNSSSTLSFTVAEKSGKLNGWESVDSGQTWEQVTTNKTTYNTTLTTTKTSDTDGGYQFMSGAYNPTLTLIDSSGNFEWNY